jgi:hypothetical protein
MRELQQTSSRPSSIAVPQGDTNPGPASPAQSHTWTPQRTPTGRLSGFQRATTGSPAPAGEHRITLRQSTGTEGVRTSIGRPHTATGDANAASPMTSPGSSAPLVQRTVDTASPPTPPRLSERQSSKRSSGVAEEQASRSPKLDITQRRALAKTARADAITKLASDTRLIADGMAMGGVERGSVSNTTRSVITNLACSLSIANNNARIDTLDEPEAVANKHLFTGESHELAATLMVPLSKVTKMFKKLLDNGFSEQDATRVLQNAMNRGPVESAHQLEQTVADLALAASGWQASARPTTAPIGSQRTREAQERSQLANRYGHDFSKLLASTHEKAMDTARIPDAARQAVRALAQGIGLNKLRDGVENLSITSHNAETTGRFVSHARSSAIEQFRMLKSEGMTDDEASRILSDKARNLYNINAQRALRVSQEPSFFVAQPRTVAAG